MLIDLVLGRQPRAGEAPAWDRLVALADDWGVLPALHRWIDGSAPALRPAVSADLAARRRAAFVTTVRAAQFGVEVCRQLRERGIAVVLFKGAAALAHLYPDPGHRKLIDADILVREQQLERCLCALEGMGLQPEHGGDLAGYRNAVRCLPGFDGNESLAVRGANGIELDVHWSLGPRVAPELRVERIVERAVEVELFGEKVAVTGAPDGLLLSAHHTMRANFAPDGMMTDLLDFGRWLDLLNSRGEWPGTLEQVERCRLAPAVSAMAAILGRPEVVDGLESRGADGLVDLFRIQARDGPLGKDLVHLADPRAVAKFVRGAARGWRGYRRHMAALEIKAGGKAAPVGRRIRSAAVQLLSLGWRRWRALRALAKAKGSYQDHGPG
jgi:hypothetical protein